MEKKGLLHIYCGDGKGKSTACTGLAVRACGTGMKVIFSQFMKSGTSGEVKSLKALGIDYRCCEEKFGFFWNMTDEEKVRAAAAYQNFFEQVTSLAVSEQADLLIMDEFMSAYNHNFIDHASAIEFLKNRPATLEVVLSGRDPKPELLELADYVSEVCKVKHPFDQGINARKGIEF